MLRVFKKLENLIGPELNRSHPDILKMVGAILTPVANSNSSTRDHLKIPHRSGSKTEEKLLRCASRCCA